MYLPGLEDLSSETGLEISSFEFRGLAKRGIEPAELSKIRLQACVGQLKLAIKKYSKIYINLCDCVYSSFQRSPLALGHIRPGLYRAFGLFSKARGSGLVPFQL